MPAPDCAQCPREKHLGVGTPRGVALRLWALGLGLLGLGLPLPALAVHQPVRVYTTAEGLPGDTVTALATDTLGRLLVGGDGVLSIFDGTSFTTLGPESGLPPGRIEAILRTRAGAIWIGTSGVLARLEPRGAERFTFVRANHGAEIAHVLCLAEDDSGRVWVGTEKGLRRLETAGSAARLSEPVGGLSAEVTDIAFDRSGRLWAATSTGLALLDPGSEQQAKTYTKGLPETYLTSVLVDRAGRIWAGTRTRGLCRLPADPDRPGANLCDRHFTLRDGLVTDWIRVLFESSDGILNVGTGGGLSRYVGYAGESRGTPAFQPLSTIQGIPSGAVDVLIEDVDRNLWLGTEDAGVVKLVTGGMVSFGMADGLDARPIASTFEDGDGAFYVMTAGIDARDLHRLDGERFTAVRPRLPGSIRYLGWGSRQISFHDRRGVWWIATGEGLCRYPKGIRFEELSRSLPERVYTTRDGLAGDDIFRLFEDRRGDIWIGTIGPGHDGLNVWRRGTDRIANLSRDAGFPAAPPSAFAEDRNGGLWVGLYPGGLVRIADPENPGAGMEVIRKAQGLPPRSVTQLLVDATDRLWVGTTGGLACLKDPGARPRKFQTWTRQEGLAADDVNGIGDDASGRLYLASSAGVTRLDPKTGGLRRFTTADGLPRTFVGSSYRDAKGNLWFGTRDGLARLTPVQEPSIAPPPVMIRAVQVAGQPASLSVLGERRVAGLKLGSGQNRIRVEFGSVCFRGGESVAFQYRLDGIGAWSPPSVDRSILLDGMPPGGHRFEVRAVSPEGIVSREPAMVSFAVQPPLWRRPWFLAGVALLLGAALYLWHRAREARAVAIERVRSHIATDLHDDIGATLSQIAILNEVALARLDGAGRGSRPLLESAAQSARELVDTMADIVWSVDPRRDQLGEVIGRMRRLAEEVCTARGIELSLEAPQNGDRPLSPSVRRQVFLVFKESLNNALKHSGCGAIRVAVRLAGRRLDLTVSDNGRGFDPLAAREGNGLASMRARARSVGGSFDLTSQPGGGTQVRFSTPL